MWEMVEQPDPLGGSGGSTTNRSFFFTMCNKRIVPMHNTYNLPLFRV